MAKVLGFHKQSKKEEKTYSMTKEGLRALLSIYPKGSSEYNAVLKELNAK